MITDLQMQNLLDTLTEAVLGGQVNPNELLKQHNISYEKLDGLLNLIYRLQATLVEQRPSAKFTRRLKQDLIDPDTEWIPLPDLSGRAQVVAGVVAFACAGVMGAALILHRRMMGQAAQRLLSH